jgi:anti-sigma factor RsiW
MLSLHLDGRLRPEASLRLGRHVSACPSCERAAESMAVAWGRIGLLEAAPEAPDDFGRLLVAVARREADRDERRTRGWRALVQLFSARRLAAASLAAGVLAGSAAGFAVDSVAFERRAPASPPEMTLLAEGVGDLPFGSPAGALARAVIAREVPR